MTTLLVFGEVLADIFPEKQVLGGAPLNVSCHLHAFGLPTVLISRLGRDDVAQAFFDLAQRTGLDTSGIQQDPEHPSGEVKVELDARGGHQFDILPDRAYDFIDEEAATAIALAAQAPLIYFGSLAQRQPASRQALKRVLATGGEGFLDINLRAPWFDQEILEQSLAWCRRLKVNDDELTTLARMFDLPLAPEQTARALMRRFDIRQIVVTCGAAGAWLLEGSGEIHRRQGTPLSALVDTVGAGDGFASVYLLGTTLGWPPSDTLARADAFAGALCGIRGAIPESSEFYQPFRREWGLGES